MSTYDPAIYRSQLSGLPDAGYVKIVLRSDNTLLAVMPSGNIRVLATN